MQTVEHSELSEKTRRLLTSHITGWSSLFGLTQGGIEALAGHDAVITREIAEFQFTCMVRASGLSNRARNVLLSNVSTIFDLMRLSREEIADFWSCGTLTVAEILDYQRSTVCRLGGDCDLCASLGSSNDSTANHELRDPIAVVPEDRDSWIQALQKSNLSVRTVNVLQKNVDSFVDFFRLDEKELLHLRNCGRKTLKEILSFRNDMAHQWLGPQMVEPETEEVPSVDLAELDARHIVLPSIREILSERARSGLHTLGVETLQEFLSLEPESMRDGRNIGRKTIRELTAFQEVVWELVKGMSNGNIEEFNMTAFGSALGKAQSRLKGTETVNLAQFDLDSLHASLVQWVTDVCRHLSDCERTKTIFLLRYGLLGETPLTLEEIGFRFDLSKERVRQIVAKVERKAAHPIHAHRLTRLINRIASITEERGGKIRKATIIPALKPTQSDMTMFPDTGPFIEFLSTLFPWAQAGLELPDGDFLFSAKARSVIERLSSVFVKLAKENADEIIEEDLWSVQVDNLKRALVDWYNDNHFGEEVKTLSGSIIDELVEENRDSALCRNGRLYSIDLWELRFGKIASFVETVLKRGRRALHFTDLALEWEKWRPLEPRISEHNIHSAAGRTGGAMLWGRGAFVHQESISIPHGLIGKIESWTLNRLKEDIPFVSAYGAFLAFEDKCREAAIPNETALYSVMKKLSHPLLQYPRLPYILLNRPGNVRMPVPLAVEQYIRENGGTVTYDELCHYVTRRLWLKDFQFQQLSYQIPNVVRAGESGFIHIDSLSIDPETVRNIVAYASSIAAREGHVSVTKVYEDRRLSCRTMGLDSPLSYGT